MALRDTGIGSVYYRLLNSTIIPLVQKSPVTPNQVTLAGLGLAALAPLGFYLHPFFGFLFMGLSALVDCLDGLVARAKDMASPFGAFLDSTLDRASDAFFLAGFWVLFWGEARLKLATALVFAAFLSTVLISYTRARAEGLGIACTSGLFERGLRTVYLLVWALLLALFPLARTPLLWWGLAIFICLTLATVLQRIFLVRAAFKATK
ncbi:MAG: CDP-alcohol phosphatidyltransferase family protein [Desulfatibacillaceae bacterium]|nr:CDP-alcohol phosphatidyltransferase family protein [Desulfatibacillaceae bacterium]